MSKSRSGNSRDNNKVHQRRKFACVEWVGDSPDSLGFTHNVPLEWVRGYDPEEKEDSYVVEWRQPPLPKGGWHFYDGIVHEVSEDEEFLKSSMQRLKRKKGDFNSISDMHQSQKQAPQVDSPEFRQLLAAAVKEAIANANRTPHRPREEAHENQKDKVVIGKSLTLDRTAFNMAKLASTPGRMVGICLRQAFSRRRLIRSSYAGQTRTRNGLKVVKPSLKKYQKTQDIQNFVLERFPYLTQSAFSAAVNSFLGETPNKVRDQTFISESESECEFDSE